MIEMRAARKEEAPLALSLIQEAKEYQLAQGFVQWTDDYPDLAIILEDIRQGRGYLLTEDQLPFGYLCLDFGGEPVYSHIEGAWKTSLPYGVIHRMAFGHAGRGKGRSRDAFRLAKERCLTKNVHALRVDTHQKNTVMQHILQREGYQICGTVYYAEGPRLAYELDF